MTETIKEKARKHQPENDEDNPFPVLAKLKFGKHDQDVALEFVKTVCKVRL